jgi:hypothetical protein
VANSLATSETTPTITTTTDQSELAKSLQSLHYKLAAAARQTAADRTCYGVEYVIGFASMLGLFVIGLICITTRLVWPHVYSALRARHSPCANYDAQSVSTTNSHPSQFTAAAFGLPPQIVETRMDDSKSYNN